jgi:hypothetical protein
MNEDIIFCHYKEEAALKVALYINVDELHQ